MTRVAFILSLLVVGICILSCTSPATKDPEIVVVRVPPFEDPSLTKGENLCRFAVWRSSPNGDKDIDIEASCKGAAIPNDAGIFLKVRLNDDETISLNNEVHGSITDLSALRGRLHQIFEERRVNGVYSSGASKVEKEVGISVPVSTRYGEFFKLTRAVKESGADPILLVLDGHIH